MSQLRSLPISTAFGCALIGCVCATGCQQPESRQANSGPHRSVVLLPGVEGGAWQLDGTVKGLRDGGINGDFDVISWGQRPFGSLDNLTNINANKARSKTIAERITGHQREHPDRPITLIGFSGGGGLAVLVAEALPKDTVLDRLILVGAAISPQHDLREARARFKHGIVNIYSIGDWFILGAGTSVFGTIDRANTASAGHVGFQTKDGKLRVEDGLTQIAWQAKWIATGHDGGHIGWLARPWAEKYLAPIISSGAAPQ